MLARTAARAAVAVALIIVSGCGGSGDGNHARCGSVRAGLLQLKTDSDRRHSERGTALARRALRCGVFRNATEQQVLRLLGTPETREARGWQYLLGPEAGPFGADDNWLYLEFARTGRVSAARVAGG